VVQLRQHFALQPEGKTTEQDTEAWTHLIWVLMKRADFEYNLGLVGEPLYKNSLMEAKKQGDKTPNAYGLIPATSPVEST
jgi:hypothetical protein